MESNNTKIHRLEESVVNRIAAGEVIQRPANALKELIENCLDAGATTIAVTVKEGGMRLLQVQDNGTGIRRDDMAIVCERFTTSKLSHFEDLRHLATYGFRGEALASITHVSHVHIISKRRDEPMAYRARYEDGRMLPFLPTDAEPSVQSCAGQDGTTVVAEDLFYNVPTRRKALRSANEEYARVLEVVVRYALHNHRTHFSLRVAGQPSAAVLTTASRSRAETARILFGAELLREALTVQREDAGMRLKLDGLLANPSALSSVPAAKKGPFILFINHRWVESPALQKRVLEAYAPLLPRHAKPFVYLALELPPEHVDVNVHPTKSAVHVLNEATVFEFVGLAVESALKGLNQSRLLPVEEGANLSKGAPPTKKSADCVVESTNRESRVGADSSSSSQPSKSPSSSSNAAMASSSSPAAHRMVRTDEHARSVLTLFSRMESGGAPAPVSTALQLTSVQMLLEATRRGCSESASQILARHVYVGCVDRRYALMQHGLDLVLAEVLPLSRSWAYQRILEGMGALPALRLDTPLSLVELATLGGASSPEEVAAVWMEHADLLQEYYSVKVVAGRLEQLPKVWEGYLFAPERLPAFVVALGSQVNWTDEQPCLEAVARRLAELYAVPPGADGLLCDRGTPRPYETVLQHSVLPSLRSLRVPSSIADSSFSILAHLPNLYKVFERC